MIVPKPALVIDHSFRMSASPLRVYRSMLKLAKSLPVEQRSGTSKQIKVEFRKNVKETDEKKYANSFTLK